MAKVEKRANAGMTGEKYTEKCSELLRKIISAAYDRNCREMVIRKLGNDRVLGI